MSIISASTTSTTAYKVTADTTGTLVFQTGATPTTALTIGSDQSVTFAGAVNTTGNQVVTGNLSVTGSLTTTGSVSAPNTFGFKNRIINGAMVIDQRNAGAVTGASSFTVDRFFMRSLNDGAYSGQQDASAPTGFTKSTKITVTTADSSLTTTQSLSIRQRVEGFNIADFGWGAAGAATVTLSFWVRSSVTGTYGGSICNGNEDRSYPFTFAISAANTWEQKTVTIAGDTSGTWATDNSTGLNVFISMGAGPDRSGTAGAWNGNTNYSATGAINMMATNGATFYITGVQLEKGSTATSFDYRPYGTELALCQRYYQRTNSYMGVGASGGVALYGYLSFITQMRASPTLSSIGGALYISDGVAADYNQSSTSVAINSSRVSAYGLCYEAGNFSGMTNYRSYFSKQDYAGGFAMSAEL